MSDHAAAIWRLTPLKIKLRWPINEVLLVSEDHNTTSSNLSRKMNIISNIWNFSTHLQSQLVLAVVIQRREVHTPHFFPNGRSELSDLGRVRQERARVGMLQCAGSGVDVIKRDQRVIMLVLREDGEKVGVFVLLFDLEGNRARRYGRRSCLSSGDSRRHSGSAEGPVDVESLL